MNYLRHGLLGLLLLASAVFLPSAAQASNCAPFTFTLTNGQTADANQVMANFNTLLNCSNNNLAHNGANSDITSLLGLTTPLSVPQGGTGLGTLTPHGVILGQGTSTPTFAPPVTAGFVLTDNGGGSDPTFQPIPSSATSGFINRLRDNSLTSWFHGCVSAACTITTSGGWCAEGVYVIPAGASVTCQQTATTPTGAATYYGVKITGNTSVSDVLVRFVQESFSAAPLAGRNSTFQALWLNNTGVTVTPTIQTRFPATQDSWGSPSTDLSVTNMQACVNNASCTEAYTLAVSASAKQGYEENIDFGNNFSSSGASMTLAGGFDFRAAPTAVTGLTAAPQTPEVRDAASDRLWNQRFYETSYENGVLPGTATRNGMQNCGAVASTTELFSVNFRAPKRADPTMSYWDGAGTANEYSSYAGGYADGTGTTTALTAYQNLANFTISFSSGLQNIIEHFAADATITGG